MEDTPEESWSEPFTTTDSAHGRLEQRTIRIAALEQRELDYPGARSIAILTRQVEIKKTGKSSSETVAYISDLLEPTAQTLHARIRGHWIIESMFHVRDATLLEDRHTMHTKNGPMNFALLRGFAIGVAHLTGAPSLPDAANQFRHFAHGWLAPCQIDPLKLAA